MRARWSVVVALAAAWTLGWWWWHRPAEGELLVNQFWVERMPRSERDMVVHMALLQMDKGRAGAVGESSVYRLVIDFVDFTVTGNRLLLLFPQENAQLNMTWRAWKCAGQAPKPFELCLDLNIGGETVHLYSLEEWAIDPGSRALPDNFGPGAGLPLPALSTKPLCADCRDALPATSDSLWRSRRARP